MTERTFTVSKTKVYDDVSQLTEYAGARSGNADIYRQIAANEFDSGLLDRFWKEAQGMLTSSAMRYVSREEEDAEGNYSLVLLLPDSFCEELMPDMESTLHSFFVKCVAAKWYMSVNSQNAPDAAKEAEALLDDFMRKAVHNRPPRRPQYNN